MPRFHIIQFMSFTVIAAIIVVILGRPAEGLVLIPILLGLVIVSRIVLPFIPNSLEAVLRKPPEDLDRHIVALKRALANQSVIRFGPIAQARYTLMQLYMRQQRFGDGIAQGREFLARYRTPRSVKSRVHLDIAFCLDCLGREDEAKAEQRLARDWLDIPPVDAVGWLVQGKLFAAGDRHDLAIDAYKRALQMPAALTQINLTDVRVLSATACLKVGRFEDAIQWSELALKLESSRSRMLTLTRLAGAACSTLGRVSEQEDHYRRAYALALEAQNKKSIADCLACLAELERSRGNIAKALSMCLEAEALAPDHAREAYHIHANICRTHGQFEEAVERLKQAGQVGAMIRPRAERHTLAILKLHSVQNRADLSQIDQAWDDLRQAKGELERDPRFGLWCEALGVRLMAIQGARAKTAVRAEELLRQLDGQALSVPVRSQCLGLLGRAFIDVGEYTSAIGCFERFLDETPHRINHPIGYYYLGECRRHLGDLPSAIEEFKRATSVAIDCHHSRLAEQRLRELRSPQEPTADHDHSEG